MSRKKTKKVPYFNDGTEKAIQIYNNESDVDKRNLLFEQEILYPILKLSEYLINSMHMYNIMDDGNIKNLQFEIVNDVLTKLDKINTDKGKAFSYLHIVIRNFLIGKSKKVHNKKINKIELEYFDTFSFFDENHYYIDGDSKNDISKFVTQFTTIIKDNINLIYDSEQERNIIIDILDLFYDSSHLNKINKRELYAYIKNKYNIESKFLTSVLKDLKIIYIKAYAEFNDIGMINVDSLLRKYKESNINKLFKF